MHAYSFDDPQPKPVDVKELNMVSIVSVQNKTDQEIEAKIGPHINSIIPAKSTKGMAILTNPGEVLIEAGKAKCSFQAVEQNKNFTIELHAVYCKVKAQ